MGGREEQTEGVLRAPLSQLPSSLGRKKWLALSCVAFVGCVCFLAQLGASNQITTGMEFLAISGRLARPVTWD